MLIINGSRYTYVGTQIHHTLNCWVYPVLWFSLCHDTVIFSHNVIFRIFPLRPCMTVSCCFFYNAHWLFQCVPACTLLPSKRIYNNKKKRSKQVFTRNLMCTLPSAHQIYSKSLYNHLHTLPREHSHCVQAPLCSLHC